MSGEREFQKVGVAKLKARYLKKLCEWKMKSSGVQIPGWGVGGMEGWRSSDR